MNDDNQTAKNPAAAPVAAPANGNGKRKRALLSVTAVTLLAAIGYGAYWWIYQRHYESTDNAYVQAPVVLITPQVTGTVLAILADDTDSVKAGQALVRLDPTDARLGLERAESQLAQTVREVRTLYANDDALAANIKMREAEVARVQADVARATDDVNRRKPLLETGAVGGEEMKHAETTLASLQSALAGTRSALAAAQEQATSNRALTEGTNVQKHPNVERAAAAVREAYLALQRVELPAPVTGQVAKRTVQVGQRVAPGTPLMSVIPLDQVWIEANFKEVQLREMRIGQPVKLRADLYGNKIEYDGHVAGLGAGTGAAFALLPAQNATGNWIKVVQRVPVRVELDQKQLADHPLRVGLSMEATVDIAQQTGAPVLSGNAPRASSRTDVFEAQNGEADRLVSDIIATNIGKPVVGRSRGTATAKVAAAVAR
ncbi:MAG TPA: HlyD family efflux transporter periplasmic adaptor subunit [Burkholderiaceae bacterium]|nr:HlyD family efflux transporter periplasmic adaptor subunit [Burkholderiaceae bacterium]